ncbi:hypothetical protein [Ectopseudomonas oleovorans]|uniref:Uncharacterized protein n=1 Tax=Ectopseudomonas oleovorans TaxID=301 RepID=A0A3D9EV08_ECTOL|nr:hypothetical protein [Pseudomonas oleovorans]RED07003.1 hypothetical protein DFO60_1509 [Pseudomonas oleovorans]
MFNITQSPIRPAGTAAVDMVVFVQGSVLTINDEAFDFSVMEKGSSLPHYAVKPDRPGAEYFAPGDITCDDAGVINVALLVPVGPGIAEDLPVLEGKKYGKVIDVHIPPLSERETADA